MNNDYLPPHVPDGNVEDDHTSSPDVLYSTNAVPETNESVVTVSLLPTAWDGLATIKLRVRAQFRDEVADRVTDQILTVLSRLEQFPDSGVPTPDPWLNKMGFRMVIADKRNVSIFRRFGDEILVYLIADTRTDYVRVFRGMVE